MKLALVTARAARNLDEDLLPLQAALLAAGAQVEIADWDDSAVDWSQYDLALLRSTWDYTDRLHEFLAWTDRVSQLTTLRNSAQTVRWNTDKHYLAELDRAGVAIVPSVFIDPPPAGTRGVAGAPGVERFLARFPSPEFVVKPAVGAGSLDALRLKRTDAAAAAAHAQRLLDANRSVLLQPYLDRIDEFGETALIFFDGRFSHAIRKGPMLGPAASTPVNGLFVPERITPRGPAADELELAHAVLAALPFEMPLYARVDLIRDAEGAPVLLELELTEPSLFFAHAPGSAERFARALLQDL
jgi:glutathione synthase/RimK-type ligase-like ATP-grasp enzyme